MYSMNHRSVERWALHRSVNLRGLVFKHQIGTFEMRSQITCEAVQHGAKGQAMFFNQILGEGFDYFSQERVNVSFICYWRGLEKASMFLLRNVSQKQQSVNDYSSWFVDVAILGISKLGWNHLKICLGWSTCTWTDFSRSWNFHWPILAPSFGEEFSFWHPGAFRSGEFLAQTTGSEFLTIQKVPGIHVSKQIQHNTWDMWAHCSPKILEADKGFDEGISKEWAKFTLKIHVWIYDFF